MRVRRSLLIIFAITVVCGVLRATEFRSPLILERGPMRYVFEEWEESDYGLKLWAAGFERESHKAFLSHGTNTYPLSTLFFNKSCFTLNEIFPSSCVPITTQYYTPFLLTTQLKPRITYHEKGISLGARWALPIFENKGRIGLRVQVPLRKIEIEREDHGDKDTNQLDDLMTREIVTRESDDGGDDDSVHVYARAIRMDFLQALPYTSDGRPILGFTDDGVPQITGVAALWDTDVILGGFFGGSPENRICMIVHSPVGAIPREPDRFIGINYEPAVEPTTLPADGNVSDDTQYKFSVDVSGEPDAPTAPGYSALNIYPSGGGCSASALEAASKLWVTSVHTEADRDFNFTAGSEKIWQSVDNIIGRYTNENIFEWLDDRGFEFATGNRCGVGDIDLDLFYEHQLNDDVALEAMLGVRIPTGSDNYCCNPYKPHLGNGKHWEIKVGGMVAWQPTDWMNIKLDGRYAFVLKSEEKRPAAFKGACIKNMGPCVTADVDWEYFVGTADLNLFHPKTDAISFVLGYELYYKNKDSIYFKCKTVESWLGQSYDPATDTWSENKQELDHCVAEKYTDAITHKARVEASFRINKYFELFAGGAYTVAGRNAPRDCDCFGGFIVTF